MYKNNANKYLYIINMRNKHNIYAIVFCNKYLCGSFAFTVLTIEKLVLCQ